MLIKLIDKDIIINLIVLIIMEQLLKKN